MIFRRGALDGAVVVVVNTHDGREGRLPRATDGSYVASAPTGRCSVAMLLALEKAMVRDAASIIGARP